jgi:hypothetical protein
MRFLTEKTLSEVVIKIIVVIKTVVACVIRWVNVNQFYFSSKVAFKGV